MLELYDCNKYLDFYLACLALKQFLLDYPQSDLKHHFHLYLLYYIIDKFTKDESYFKVL